MYEWEYLFTSYHPDVYWEQSSDLTVGHVVTTIESLIIKLNLSNMTCIERND